MGSASRGGFSSIPGLHLDSWTTCTPASPSTVIAFKYAVGSPASSYLSSLHEHRNIWS